MSREQELTLLPSRPSSSSARRVDPSASARAEAVRNLPRSPLWKRKFHEGFLSYEERVLTSVERAKLIVRAYNLSAHDVAALTQPFWDLHCDPCISRDPAAGTLAMIQINLAAGTLVNHIAEHPALRSTMEDILHFDVMAHYCLTEIAHGIDAVNIETTATLQPDGGYLLHTPHASAAKIMPPTAPCGVPAVGIVFAKLVVDGENQGTRAFILPFNDGKRPAPGITVSLLPPRENSPPMYHSITSFNQVRMPPHALLGPLRMNTRDAASLRATHNAMVWRVAVGSLAVTCPTISALDISAFICGKYSQRRTVGQPEGGQIPILAFRTQQIPIITAAAQSAVSKAFRDVAVANFRNAKVDMRVRHAWAVIFKAVVSHHGLAGTLALASRCGAQGLFAHNDILALHGSILGLSIAEGDVLAVSIRLAVELLLGRYQLPDSTHPTSLLARHEQGLLEENRAFLKRCGNHRSAEFNNLVLPRCEPIVRAIGHRMAYDAAVDAGLDPRITDVYVASVLKHDPAWYIEHTGLSREQVDVMEDKAMRAALPCLNEWLDATGVEPYVQAPLLTQSNWDAFRAGLPTFRGPQAEDTDAPRPMAMARL